MTLRRLFDRGIWLRCALSGLVALSCGTASANVGETYGFGSRTAALGGAGAAYGYGAFAAYHNPAGLPFQGEKRLLIDVGMLLMTPSFTPISNVIVENSYTSDKITYSDVADDYRSTFGTELGLTYRLFPETYNFTFGVTAFLPLQQLAYMDTGETFVPEYFMYRARTQRPQVEIGFGAELGHGFQVGLGIHLAFSLTSSGTVFLQTDSNKPSTMRFAASLKPKLAPEFALHYSPPNNPDVAQAGLVVRLPVSSSNSLFLKSGARAFGSFAALDFDFNSTSTLFYDPLTVELGGSVQMTRRWRTYAQLDYEAWGKYEAPALVILNPTNESCGNAACGVNISAGKNPVFQYRDILVPRLGEEFTFGRTILRFGYVYHPGIIVGIPTGAGNYLDPSKHEFTAGMGFQFPRFLSFDTPCELDFHLSYQALVGSHVTKDPGDENGNGSGDLKIGAPGYDIGGKIYGGGVSLSLAF